MSVPVDDEFLVEPYGEHDAYRTKKVQQKNTAYSCIERDKVAELKDECGENSAAYAAIEGERNTEDGVKKKGKVKNS